MLRWVKHIVLWCPHMGMCSILSCMHFVWYLGVTFSAVILVFVHVWIFSFSCQFPCTPLHMYAHFRRLCAILTYCFADVKPYPERKPDCMYDHAIFDQTAMDQLMPPDVTYFASFRHPISQFESAVAHFRLNNLTVEWPDVWYDFLSHMLFYLIFCMQWRRNGIDTRRVRVEECSGKNCGWSEINCGWSVPEEFIYS